MNSGRNFERKMNIYAIISRQIYRWVAEGIAFGYPAISRDS